MGPYLWWRRTLKKEKEQVDKAASLKVSQKKKEKTDDVSSSEEEEEEANDKLIKSTRYGRIPQKTQLLNYPANEEGDLPSDSAPAPASNGSPSTSSSFFYLFFISPLFNQIG